MKFDPPANSNYACMVVKIPATITLPGLDNLVGVPVLGHQALTQKDKQAGELALAFTAETQLSEEYAAYNNLFRDSSLNRDQAEKGYLEANRRIRALKLRGHRSDALLMPLESIAYTGVDISQLQEGDVFDVVNGHEICRKYTLPVKRQPQAKSKVEKAFKRVDTKLFPEHISTDQFHRNQHLLRPGREIVITQKLHGCFPAKAKVTMWDGTQKRISCIVPGDVVCGVDHETGRLVPSRVLNAATTGVADKWAVVKVRYPLKGDDARIFATPDHQVFTENRGYVEVAELRGDDILAYERYLPQITDEKRAILEGMLLGDGSLVCTGGNYGIVWGCKEDHLEALEYRQALLGNLCTQSQRRRISGYGTSMVDAGTIRHPAINSMAERWGYAPHAGKRVPADLTLSDLTVATFYMDDGSLAHSELQRDRACFAICDWDDASAEHIRQAFIRWGMANPVVYKDPTGYNRIRLNADDAWAMFERIADLIPPVMAYKLPRELRHRATGSASLPDRWAHHTVRGEVKDVSYASAKRLGYSTKYDIETETHNFFANHVLVHNSSIRVGRVPCLRQKGIVERFLNRWIKTPDCEYDAVAGSRKVIKDRGNAAQNHYYGFDLWSDYSDRVKDLIPEGYILYGELVGWTKDSEGQAIPIQKNYTYNLPVGECELYVYRVATINTQGTLADLPWDAVKEFCLARGLKWTPEMGRVTFGPPTPWSAEDLERYVDEMMDMRYADYYDEHIADSPELAAIFDRPVPLSDKKTVDEGVVLRQEGIVPVLLKAKAPAFLLHETKLLDAEEQDIESAA
ncbi:RNA ligase [Mycobacterium phage Phoebus]|nr:RNA ligase [Mycobacterium phage Phoebus]